MSDRWHQLGPGFQVSLIFLSFGGVPCLVKCPQKTLLKLLFGVGVHSALKSSLKTAKRLQLDWTKTPKDWSHSLGRSILRLEDCKNTGYGGPVLSVKSGLLYPSKYPSKHT